MSEARPGGAGTLHAGLVVSAAAAVVFAGTIGLAWTALGPQPLRPLTASTDSESTDAYSTYCRACHGDAGDGMGPASAGLRPPPRDFRQAIFKYGWMAEGLPRDEDLARIVRGGLHGAMPAWQLSDGETASVIARVKGFAPGAWIWGPGTPLEVTPDPWSERTREAEALGRELYHGRASCSSCHPAQDGGDAGRERPELPVPRASAELRDGRPLTLLPPDFTFHEMRSVREGSETEDLFRVIAAGMPGTAMPSWKDALTDAQIWALAHYVESLAQGRQDELTGVTKR